MVSFSNIKKISANKLKASFKALPTIHKGNNQNQTPSTDLEQSLRGTLKSKLGKIFHKSNDFSNTVDGAAQTSIHNTKKTNTITSIAAIGVSYLIPSYGAQYVRPHHSINTPTSIDNVLDVTSERIFQDKDLSKISPIASASRIVSNDNAQNIVPEQTSSTSNYLESSPVTKPDSTFSGSEDSFVAHLESLESVAPASINPTAAGNLTTNDDKLVSLKLILQQTENGCQWLEKNADFVTGLSAATNSTAQERNEQVSEVKTVVHNLAKPTLALNNDHISADTSGSLNETDETIELPELDESAALQRLVAFKAAQAMHKSWVSKLWSDKIDEILVNNWKSSHAHSSAKLIENNSPEAFLDTEIHSDTMTIGSPQTWDSDIFLEDLSEGPDTSSIDSQSIAGNPQTSNHHMEQQIFFNLAHKCYDSSLTEADWVPILDLGQVQHPSIGYLPTVIYENNKTLGKFLKVFHNDPSTSRFYELLKVASDAFTQLDMIFKRSGMLDNVVEYLRPANHPKRTLERLQQLQTQHQHLQERYRLSQEELHSYTEKGAAEDIYGEQRACITVAELEELEAECQSWRTRFEGLKRVQQRRLDDLERKSKPLEAKVQTLQMVNDLVQKESAMMLQRQEDCYAHYDIHKFEPGAAEELTSEMHKDLVEEFRYLLNRVYGMTEDNSAMVAENVELKQKLRQEVAKVADKDLEIAKLKAELEKVTLAHDSQAFDWDSKDAEYYLEIKSLKRQVEACSYRTLLTQEQMQDDAIKFLRGERDRFDHLYQRECDYTSNLLAELHLAYELGPGFGEILADAERLEAQRLPSRIWIPPREWNAAYTQDPAPQAEEEDELDDPDIF